MTRPPAGGAPPPPPALRATCWGTRGSLPSPGPATVRHGGNTPCVEVRTAAGRLVILDAGTGLRALGRRLGATPGAVEADLFLTHYHWDHLQGLPFFAPLHDAATRLRLHGPREGGVGVEEAVSALMAPAHFPVPLGALPARLTFADLGPGPWREGGVEVAALPVRHPGPAAGYRVRAGGATLAYLPDNELGDAPGRDDGGYAALVEGVRGADLLLHDATYTDAEYARARGWGHSTFGQAVRLAEDAGVRRLLFFHHAPDRADDELDAILARVRAELGVRRSALQVGMATEGEEVAVGGAPTAAEGAP